MNLVLGIEVKVSSLEEVLLGAYPNFSGFLSLVNE